MRKLHALIFLFCISFSVFSQIDSVKTLTVIGVGDMMLGTNYPSTRHLAPNDGKNLLDSVKHILKDADVTFGNLEGTLAGDKGKVKRCRNPKLCYAFRSPSHYGTYFKDAGFDLLSIANNHSGDFGAEGRQITMQKLQENGIAYAGLLSCPTTVIERNGVKYGLAAFAPNSGTVNIRRIEAAKEIIKNLDSICDIVIVSFHGGAEGRSKQHVTKKTEYYVGEDRGNIYAFSHAVIDAGADIVFGHGPHVTRAMELYKDRLICYSLGNFATYDRFSLTAQSGVAPIVKVSITPQGEFVKAQITPIKQIGEGIPRVDHNKKWATKILQQLTAQDFPNTPLNISDNGLVLKK